VTRRDRVWADEDRALVRIRDLSLYVAGGDRVVVQAPDLAARSEHDYLVYGWAARLLLWQRRRLTLHAALVVTPDGRAVALAGDSGAGKSTTTVELIRRGWRYACDDVAELALPGPQAVPFERPVHLSDDAARLLGADPAVGRPLPWRSKRVYALEPDLLVRPLAAVVRLSAAPVDRPVAQVLEPVEALMSLLRIGDRIGIVELPALRRAHVDWLGALVRTVPVVNLDRPATGDTVGHVADLVEEAVLR
jgi:hypothetical protein